MAPHLSFHFTPFNTSTHKHTASHTLLPHITQHKFMFEGAGLWMQMSQFVLSLQLCQHLESPESCVKGLLHQSERAWEDGGSWATLSWRRAELSINQSPNFQASEVQTHNFLCLAHWIRFVCSEHTAEVLGLTAQKPNCWSLFTYLNSMLRKEIQHLSPRKWEVIGACLTSIDITLPWQYKSIWQIRPWNLLSRTSTDGWKAIGIFFLNVLGFFMMDNLDFDGLLHHWPALWRAPNTAALMSCLSESPFGFNKLINLYLLSSRHDQIKKRTWFPSLTLQPDTPIDK